MNWQTVLLGKSVGMEDGTALDNTLSAQGGKVLEVMLGVMLRAWRTVSCWASC